MKTDVLERLAAHRVLSGVPREELEWLAEHGEMRRFPAGTVIVEAHGESIDALTLMFLFSGQLAVYIDRVGGRRKMSEWHGGDVTGLMPYSRMQKPLGDVVIEADTEVLQFRRDQFRELTRECPSVTAILVHAMLDRARMFTSTDWQDEKMVSLGRLAAGLAHELNNPASAVARGAKLLATILPEAEEAARALGATPVTDAERVYLAELRGRPLVAMTTGVFSAIERSDREDEVVDWLEAHGVDTALAESLSENGVETGALDELAEALSPGVLGAALRSIAANYTARSLASDIERAATRIHDLVSSVKRFTYMDRAAVAGPFDIAQGLADTVAVIASKAREKSVMVRLDVPSDLPRVHVVGAELNQVWANLLENAIDAVPPMGNIIITATREDSCVVVRIVDDGPGIPDEIKGRIFDPFFTTKPIGKGTGLGLDIARRVMARHHGQLDVDSRPGRTEFRVSIPLDTPAA